MTIQRSAPLKTVLLAGTATLFLGYPAAASSADMSATGIAIAQAAPDRQDRENRDSPRDRDGKPAGESEERKAREQPKRQQQPAARGGADAQQQMPASRQQERRGGRSEEPQQQPPATAQPPQLSAPPAAQDRRLQPPSAPSTAQQPQRQAPAAEQKPQQQQAPQQQPAQQQRQQQQPQPAQQQRQPQQQPAATQQQQQAPAAAQGTSPAVIAPPTQTRDAREFIRRSGEAPSRGMDQVRRERRETREGDRVVIREQDRAIVREGGRTIIQHNESNRFAIGARNVRVDRRGGTTETIVERGDGLRIVSVHDADGRLVRRMRRDRSGRDVVIIDNSFAGARAGLFLQLQAPTIRIPRERYIVEMGRARPDDIYAVFMASPVERLERRYTLDQVRYNAPLRAYMPRVDLDVNFETGSWQITPDQIGKLEVIARGIMRAIEKNPLEVFLIEGHTDAVGGDDDNLSLSDRRAESVAIVLTEEFQVPPENLVTQGYGEQDLKVPTQGPSQENRRVAVRRITPLIDQQVANTGGR